MPRRPLFLALLAPSLFMTCGQGRPAPLPPKPPVSAPVAPVAPAAPPFSLTASDGSGLHLVSLEARGVVEGPLAMTELRLTFQNPEPRVREGTFEITLPPSGAISRFAMKVDDRWMEGEVVERQRARRIYEDFLHRRQDPALLEQSAANAFSARVFPIPANGTKELVISYTQEIAGADEAYRLPLVGLPAIDRVDLEVLVSRVSAGRATSNLGGQSQQVEVLRVKKQGWAPDQDLVVTPSPGAARGLRAEDLVVARVQPEFPAAADPVGGLYVLVDTSASRALGLDAQVELIGALSRGLAAERGPGTPFAVAAFDQGVTPIFEGKAGAFGQGELNVLRERMALGASDPEGALRWLAAKLKGAKPGWSRVLVVSDGVSTVGDPEDGGLRAAAKELGAVGVERLDAVALGGLRDDAALHGLVTAGLARDGVVIDGELGAGELSRRLGAAVRSGVRVEVPGAEWVWPETLDAVQPGDARLVYAQLPKAKPFSLTLDGKKTGLDDRALATVPRPLLERAAARARIDRLVTLRDTRFASDEDLREAMKQQATQLSLRHRVLSPWTALLVLETEEDYARYDLDRNALADILTVGPTGVEVLDRRGRPPATTPTGPTPRPVVEAREDLDLDSPPADGAPEAEEGAPEPIAAEGEDEADAMIGAEGEAEDEPLEDDAAGVEAAKVAEEMAPPAAAPRATISALASRPSPRPAPARRHSEARPEPEEPVREREAERPRVAPWSGPYAEVMDLLVAGRKAEALTRAKAWRAEAPGDVLALLALGAAFQANGDAAQAARCYGSLIDLFPSRADIRRTAGNWLEALGTPDALALAVDTYRQAVAERPDHPNSHRMLAWALHAAGQHEQAFAAIEVGAARSYDAGRFDSVDRILREDAGILAAAWLAAEPARRDEVLARLYTLGASLPAGPSMRFVLSWETDANDVDFHIHDGKGGHAFYSQRELPSGGALYADITTGYGPECFTIPGTPKAFPYQLQAHYYSRGPMGFGMGTLVALQDDGKGGVKRQSQPFVVMTDQAFLELGTIKAPLR